MPTDKADMVSAPDHYCKGRMYQTWEVAHDWGMDKDAYMFNALKYLSRAGRKSYAGMTMEQSMYMDLRKADAYIRRKLDLMDMEGGAREETGCRNAPDMTMGEVIDTLKAHPERRFARKGWNDRNRWIALQHPALIYMKGVRGRSAPWMATQSDLLADDWYEVPRE